MSFGFGLSAITITVGNVRSRASRSRSKRDQALPRLANCRLGGILEEVPAQQPCVSASVRVGLAAI